MSGKRCQVMVKPTGSVCNPGCQYGCYLEKEKRYPDRKNHYKMSEATPELFIRLQIAAQDSDEIIFAWQGGEPTLTGIPIYRQAVELQQRDGGGCPKHRFLSSVSGAIHHNPLRAGYQAFFSHTAPGMKAMRNLYEQDVSPAETKSIFV